MPHDELAARVRCFPEGPPVPGRGARNTTSPQAPARRERVPPGTLLALRPTRGRRGHRVSWLPRGPAPSTPCSPLGMRGSCKLGAQAFWDVTARQGRCSARDATRPGSSVGHECGSRWARPCSPPRPGCGPGSGPPRPAHCGPASYTGTRSSPASGWLGSRTFHQPWPGPPLWPRRLLTRRETAPERAEAGTTRYSGEYEIPPDSEGVQSVWTDS